MPIVATWKVQTNADRERRKAVARMLKADVLRERPDLFLTLRTGDDETARAFAKHFGNVLDQIIMGDRAAKRLSPGERTWFVLVPEQHGEGVHYHGFVRLPRISGRRRVNKNFLRFSDPSLSRFLMNIFRWKLGARSSGEVLPAFVEVHVQRLRDRSYARMTDYVLKRRAAADRWNERLDRSQFEM